MTNSVDLSIYQTKLSFKLWLGIEVPKIAPPLCVGSVETKLHTGRLPSSTQQVSSVAFGATVGWQIQWTSASIRQNCHLKSCLQNIYFPPIGTSWLPNGCAKTYQFSRCSHPAPWKIHEPGPRCTICLWQKITAQKSVIKVSKKQTSLKVWLSCLIKTAITFVLCLLVSTYIVCERLSVMH